MRCSLRWRKEKRNDCLPISARMDEEGSAGLWAWLIDLAAAAVAGAAVALCLVLLNKPLPAIPAGVGMLLLSFSALQCVRPEAPRYRLPELRPPEWQEVFAQDLRELTAPEPLPIESAAPPQGGGVIRMFPMTPIPTAGELKQRIDAHLRGTPRHDDGNVVLLSPDASAALRNALAELKRSLG